MMQKVRSTTGIGETILRYSDDDQSDKVRIVA
jgi:hypothetical protein